MSNFYRGVLTSFCGEGQQATRGGGVDPSAPQVEELLLVQVADRRSVRALHVVGKDLQVRLRVRSGVVAEQQAVVALNRVGLLRDLMDDDAAVEDRRRLIVEHTLVELVTRAVGHGVIEQRVVVHPLMTRDEVEAVERGMVLTKPGAVTPHKEFECEVYILSKDEGGRHTPFFKGYRPQFYFRTTDVTGDIELNEGVEMVMPGDNTQFKVKLIQPVAMEQGLRFAIREGGRTVGAGVVSKILD